MNGKLFFLVFFLGYRLIFSQVTEIKGNLLRIDFTKPTIDFSDTLWQWTSNDYETCSNVFFIDSTLYLLINTYDDNPYLPWTYVHLYNTKTGTKRLLVADHPPIDPLEPLLYFKSIIEYANSGCWIFNGIRALAVFLRNDSLYTFDDSDLFPIHSAGKIDSRNLLVFNSASQGRFSFYLEDLSNSPKIENSNKLEIVDSVDNEIFFVPEKIYHLKDSLYLFHESMLNTLFLASISSNKIKIIRRLIPEESPTIYSGFSDWRFSNDFLFYIDNKKLIRESYNYVTNSFSNEEILIEDVGNQYIFSNDNNYFVRRTSDSMFVYSLKKFGIINSCYIDSTKRLEYVFVDSPYVYLKEIITVTDIKEDALLPQEFVLYQNYPNPFNPSTTISYQLPAAGYVTLEVYDVLGREIATLVNNEQMSGKHEVKFNGEKLSSGVYIYKLKANNFLEVKKMLLLK